MKITNTDKVKTDCIMYHAEDGKVYCSGLREVYCSVEDCKFYKPKGDNHENNTDGKSDFLY